MSSEIKVGDVVLHKTNRAIVWAVIEVESDREVWCRTVLPPEYVLPPVGPAVFKVPMGLLDPCDPNSVTCAEWAQTLVENMDAKSTLIIPSENREWVYDRGGPVLMMRFSVSELIKLDQEAQK
jgi:hypothetical protein